MVELPSRVRSGAIGRRAAAVVLALVVAAAFAAVRPPAALGDGDPASDVLVYQPVFFPYNPAPHTLKRELNGLVKSANQQGYRIRVAVIQSPRDLGSVPVLFGKPSVYARFLSSELASIWRDRVLVVMPSGYGLAQGARLVRSGGVDRIEENTRTGPDEAVLRRLPPPRGSRPADVVAAASKAVRALAARHDIALVPAPPAASSPGGGGTGRNTGLAAAVAATVGLTAGLLWFLWRTRPRRSTG
ncbi:MAG TPA: hypothetical protein VGJ11_05295 [Gaiellales bacterium]